MAENKLNNSAGHKAKIAVNEVDAAFNQVFSELKAGRATVQSRPRNYYEVSIAYAKLPEELKHAVCA